MKEEVYEAKKGTLLLLPLEPRRMPFLGYGNMVVVCLNKAHLITMLGWLIIPDGKCLSCVKHVMSQQNLWIRCWAALRDI